MLAVGRHGMVFGEILISFVFIAALLTAVACLTYLVYVTLLERHLLRTSRNPMGVSAPRAVSSLASPAVARTAKWRHGSRSSAVPQGRG
jgi:hypothetical protein